MARYTVSEVATAVELFLSVKGKENIPEICEFRVNINKGKL